jgi:membrane associated rhomboid family serine protease
MRQHRGRSQNISPILLSLGIELFNQWSQLRAKPPVTLFLLFVNIYVHVSAVNLPFFRYEIGNINQNCLHPAKIVSSLHRCIHGIKPGILEYIFTSSTTAPCSEIAMNRLILSGFIHSDDVHLYYNMLSLSWKGINLESSLGSTKFAFIVIYALLVSHTIAVFLAFVLKELDIDASGYNTCAVGFSAVLFCLKYLWNQSSSDNSLFYGIPIPTRYLAWAECILISLVTPNASFIGHISGILAGVLFVRLTAIPTAFPSYSYMRGVLGSGRAQRQHQSQHEYRNVHLYQEEEDDSSVQVATRARAANRNSISVEDYCNEEIRRHRLSHFDTRRRWTWYGDYLLYIMYCSM